ncbi:MAG: hypothetical protein HC819_12315 [Cyclobacteriaceae bacterium]|nr:hypothetical protein [Cyclobacteriaceae bacterium]
MNVKYILLMVLIGMLSQHSHGQYSDFKYKKKNHSSEAGFAHTTRQARYLSGGAGLHLLNYFGDLTPNENRIGNTLKVTRPGISIYGNYNFSPHIVFGAQLLYGRITGDDYNADPYKSSSRKYVRNLNFRNDLIGLNLTGSYYLFKDPFEFYKRKDFNLYVTAGVSIFYSNPKGKVLGQAEDGSSSGKSFRWVALRPLGTEGQNNPESGRKKYSAIQLGIPFGGGVRIRLGYRTDLYLEATLHYLLSDYIDDVGSSYVDLGVFGDDELARKLSDRSKETVAAVKEEQRDLAKINDATTPYSYVSVYDGKTYQVYKGFGEEGGIRGGSRNDLFTLTSFKFSYIFTK